MADYDSQSFDEVIQQQGTVAPLSAAEVQPAPGPITPAPMSAIERLRQQYALEDAAAAAAVQTPMAPVPNPVQVPFASVPDQRATELQQAQDREFQMQQLAESQAASQFNTEQQLAVQKGRDIAVAAAEQKELDKQHEIDNFAAAEMNKEDQAAEQTMGEIMKGDSLGKKIGLAISVLLGGYAQGLMGSQQNPVMNFLEKLDDQVMQKRDLKAKERAAIREHALKLMDQKVKEARARTDDDKTRAELDKLGAEASKIRLDIENSRKLSKANQIGAKITNPLDLDLETRETIVRLPDGSFVLSPLGKKAATDHRQFMAETGNVVTDLDDLITFTKDKRFYNPVGADQARVQTKINTLVGALRLPITGPGPLTDTEREFLVKTIGDPSKFFSLKQNQMARLYEIQSNINRRVQNSYKQAGIDIASGTPVAQQDRLSSAGITAERRAEIENYLKLKQQAQQKGPNGGRK